MRCSQRALAIAAASAALAACDATTHQVSDSDFGAYEVSATTWRDGLALAWYDTRDGNAEIYARFLDDDGRPTGAERRLTETPAQSYEADIAATADGFAVAWYEKNADGALRAQLGYWTRSGERLWHIALGAAGANSRNAIVRNYGDALFAAWIESDADSRELVRGGWWNLAGDATRAPVTLGEASTTTWNLNAAIDAVGAAVVVFDAHVGTAAPELYLAELTMDATRVTRISADDGRLSKYPDIALGPQGAALTWFDERDGNREVYVNVGTLEHLRAGAEAAAWRVTKSPGHSIGAYAAWNGDRIGLAWSDDSSGSYEIYTQIFTVTGTPEAEPKRVTTTTTNSLIPAIRPWRNGFAIAWNEVERSQHPGHDDHNPSEVVVAFIP